MAEPIPPRKQALIDALRMKLVDLFAPEAPDWISRPATPSVPQAAPPPPAGPVNPVKRWRDRLEKEAD